MTPAKHALIVANGTDDGIGAFRGAAADGGIVIAVDGGADACLASGITPALIIGDLDSISHEARRRYEARGVAFDKHPVDKDQSDLELALQAAVSKGATRLTVYGAMGGRWDMTVANLFLLLAPHLRDREVVFTDGCQHMRLVRDGERVVLSGRPGDTLSLIPLGGTVHGVHAAGVDWPLSDDVLYPWQSRGVSNRFRNAEATISVTSGNLLCIHTEVRRPE